MSFNTSYPERAKPCAWVKPDDSLFEPLNRSVLGARIKRGRPLTKFALRCAFGIIFGLIGLFVAAHYNAFALLREQSGWVQGFTAFDAIMILYFGSGLARDLAMRISDAVNNHLKKTAPNPADRQIN